MKHTIFKVDTLLMIKNHNPFYTSPLLITAAMEKEIAPLMRKFKGKIHKPQKNNNLFIAENNGEKLYFLITGVGKRAVKFKLKKTLELIKINSIISIGMAGAVSEELFIGDNVMSMNVLWENHKGKRTINCKGVERKFESIELDIFECPGAKKVNDNLTVPTVFYSEDKCSLSNDVGIVDMETYFIAKIAKKMYPECKVFSIRSVSDERNSKLPTLGNFTNNLFLNLLIAMGTFHKKT
ncbi:MAG: hypothetical protein HQK84_07955 [Nitrospinae bacterium]|nr:hypothetical protein [Nitrospinota bacterium]